MKTRRRCCRQRGLLMTEAIIGMGILAVALIPLAFAFNQEMKVARAAYFRAVALEVVDGEMEVLAAGEWKASTPGTHAYPVTSSAATNLPPGEFRLTVGDKLLRLEWIPKGRGLGGVLQREVRRQ